MKYAIFFLITTLGLMACNNSDKAVMVGIWQNEKDWFELKSDGTYNTGTGPKVYYSNLKYALEEKNKRITFYTKSDAESYYLNYKFVHADTMEWTNTMPNSAPVIFYRVREIPKSLF